MLTNKLNSGNGKTGNGHAYYQEVMDYFLSHTKDK